MVRNASWMLGGQALNFAVQAAYFILLARLLGAGQYGVFAGAFALVSIVTPYSAMGAGMLFMRYAPKDRKLAPVYWGNSLVLTAASSLLMAIVLGEVGARFTHIDSRALFVALVFANCLLSQVVLIGGFVFQAFEKMRLTAMLTLLSNLMRLAALILMRLVWGHASALQWAYGLTLGTLFAAAVSMVLVYREIGLPAADLRLAFQRLWEGVGYSFAGSTQAVYNDVDKTLLSHYGMTAQNGPYTLAYRMIDFATSPIVSVDAVILPRYFQYGYERLQEVVSLARKAMRSVTWMGMGIGAAILAVSPVIPYLVGDGFSAVVGALQILSCLPLLRGIHRVSGSALTGMGFQTVRTISQISVAAVNLLLNVCWIPVYGWVGAAWSSVLSDGLLAVINSLLFLAIRNGWIRRPVAMPSEVIETDEIGSGDYSTAEVGEEVAR